jgi:hypothetical protein
MSGEENRKMDVDPWRDEMCRLRKRDDDAKIAKLKVAGAAAYRAMLVGVVDA